jgi:hypothetical protein
MEDRYVRWRYHTLSFGGEKEVTAIGIDGESTLAFRALTVNGTILLLVGNRPKESSPMNQVESSLEAIRVFAVIAHHDRLATDTQIPSASVDTLLRQNNNPGVGIIPSRVIAQDDSEKGFRLVNLLR